MSSIFPLFKEIANFYNSEFQEC